jgi:restriction system protein
MTSQELDWLVQSQLAKWAAQEEKKRQTEGARQLATDLKLRAEALTREAQQQVEAYRTLLVASLSAAAPIAWDMLLDRRVFPLPPEFTFGTAKPEFTFDAAKPDVKQIRDQILDPEPDEYTIRRNLGVPEERWLLEMIFPFLRSRRLRLEEEAEEEFADRMRRRRKQEKEVIETYNARVHDYNQRHREVKQQFQEQLEEYERAKAKAQRQFQERLEEYERAKGKFITQQAEHNNAVLDFRIRYERGSPEAVERYAQMVLERSQYPDGIVGEPDVQLDEAAKTLVVNFWLPHVSAVPNTIEYKYVATRKEIKPVEMKKAEFQAFYDEIIHQITLRTVHEVFRADYRRHAQAVVFNGWVRGLDPKTGKEFTSCILSCQASREQFEGFDLARVSAKECVRGLRGITAGPLAELAPVRPIMAINREDDRFIEAKAVLGGLDPRQNLATMDWEDFEHLVRELFERVFQKDGCEVKVTQASRDRGVDAVAFDPDPIRGGKFVIQAKRYNMVVPVSAVRDLYGTMIDEGATKGILVTTSHFGHDSHEFAKDKPITLIDGQNLVHMFQEYGHAVHIALAPRGERPGIGRRTGQDAM